MKHLITDRYIFRKYCSQGPILKKKRAKTTSKACFSLMLILLFSLNVTAQTNILDRNINLQLKNVRLSDALSALSDKAGVNITYSSTKLNVDKIVSVNSTNKSLKVLLNELLGKSLKRLDVKGNVITIETKEQLSTPATVEYIRQMEDLNEVVVVSSRTPKHISDIPGTVWVVDSAKLQAQIRSGVPLKEALGILIPSLDLGNQGRSNYGQNLRGRNILVMLDGVSLNSSRATNRQFDAIDPFNIEKIEVLSGASSIYGGDATGGIINIVTKKAKAEKLSLETEVGGRSGLRNSGDHDLRFAQSISAGTEVIKGRLGFAYQQNAGAFDARNRQIVIDTKQSDFQYNRTIDLFGNVDIKPGKKQTLNFDAQYYESKYNSGKGLFLGQNLAGGLPPNANNNVAPDPSLLDIRNGFSSDVVPRSKRLFVNGQYRITDVLGGQNFQFQGYWRTEKLDFSPSFPEGIVRARELTVSPGNVLPLPLAASRQNTNLWGFRMVLSKQFDQVNLTYGADFDRESFVGKQAFFDAQTTYSSGGLTNRTANTLGRFPDNRILGLSGFAQASWAVNDQLAIAGGIRRQHMSVRVDDFVRFQQQVSVNYGVGTSADAIPGGKNSYNVTLFNGSVIYKITDRQQVWANFSQGFSVPDPAKTYGIGSYERQGDHWKLLNSINVKDSPLSGVKTNQFELGWRRPAQSGWNVQAAIYYSLSDKALLTNFSTFTISVSDQHVRNYGLEAEVSYRQAPEGFDVGASAHAIVSEIKTPADGWKRNSIITNNPSKAVAYAGWKASNFSARVQGVHTFNLKDYQSLELKGFTTIDLLGSLKLPLGVLSAGVQNLFNRQYLTFWGQRAVIFYGAPSQLYEYNGRGRTYMLSYSITY